MQVTRLLPRFRWSMRLLKAIYPLVSAEIPRIRGIFHDIRRYVRHTVSRYILALLLLLPSHKIPLDTP